MRKALLGLVGLVAVLILAYSGALKTFEAFGNSWHRLATAPYVMGY